MNMRSFNLKIVFLLFTYGGAMLISCKKEKPKWVYETNDKPVYEVQINKNKLKSEAQYLSILSTDLTQLPISPTKLNRAIRVLESFGDRETANEIIISNFMNNPTLSIPPDEYMRQHTEQFILETYRRFFVRNPTQAELTFFLQFIESHPHLSVEMVYTAFASSQEYMFY
jgi:hypothetical protein